MNAELVAFHELFEQFSDGAVAPRVAVQLGGVHLAAGLRLPEGCIINDVAISTLSDCMMQVRMQNGLHIIEQLRWQG